MKPQDNHPILGTITRGWIAQLLAETGFYNFYSTYHIEGLGMISEDGEGLGLLAIAAISPGNGDFRKFIQAAKEIHSSICIWNIENPWFGGVLERYGFTPYSCVRQVGDHPETLEGIRWTRKAQKKRNRK